MKASCNFFNRVALPVLQVVHSPEVQLICKMICLCSYILGVFIFKESRWTHIL